MKDKPKILVGDKIVDEALEMLRAEADVDLKRGIKQPELEEIIENYDALIVRSVPLVTEEVIKRGKKLKVVGRAGNGVDNIDLETATQQGVVVVNTPDSNSFSAGEQTIALMLASARNLPQAHQTVKEGGWGRSRYMGSELYGKTVGIVGLGRIGSFVATRLKAFQMRVIAYDPYIPLERFKRFGVERVETLNELVRQSDIITVHTPKTEETIGMIGKEQRLNIASTWRPSPSINQFTKKFIRNLLFFITAYTSALYNTVKYFHGEPLLANFFIRWSQIGSLAVCQAHRS
jgi:D-3-phosphoglycerate dehydrogenase